jgi:O-antigen/teichoic acid export membrane protein
LAYPHVAGTIVLIALGPALQQVAELGRAVFISRQRMAVAGSHTVVENVVWAGTIAICLRSGVDLDGTFAIATAAMAGSGAVSFALVMLLARVRPEKPAAGEVRWLLRQAGPFTSFSALVVLDARMDTVLLGLLLPQGLAIAGAYYAVTRLVGVAEYLPDAVSRAIYPRIASEFARDPQRAATTLDMATRELLALGIAIPFGFALVGAWALGLLFGPTFTAYTWLLVAFGLAMPFRYIGLIFGFALTAAGHQTQRVRALAIAVGTSFILDIVLIPVAGVAGALVAVAASWIVNCVLVVVDINRIFRPVVKAGQVVQFTGLAAVAFLVGIVVRSIVGGAIGDPLSGLAFVGVGLFGMFGWPAWARGVPVTRGHKPQ